MPYDNFTITVPEYGVQRNFEFDPLIAVTDLPFRLEYPDFEKTLNEANNLAASSKLGNGDVINSKLWWDQR